MFSLLTMWVTNTVGKRKANAKSPHPENRGEYDDFREPFVFLRIPSTWRMTKAVLSVFFCSFRDAHFRERGPLNVSSRRW